ncbi:MAG: DUF86 domain-containing protein [Deltaproteobacteria bacterium]|nr:DUF86 domain-containing protein [Deltaproteobacteria bacterium]
MLGERDRERLIKHLEFMAGELGDFEKFAGYTWNDYQFDRDKRRNIERWIENLTNSVIDISKIFIAAENYPMPQSYREMLFAFGAKYFNEDFGKRIERWATLRNVVTHEYLDIKWNTIKAFLNESKPFLDEIQSKVKEILFAGNLEQAVEK